MSTSPVQLDFSTFQPLQQGNVNLDMSTFQPLQGQQPQQAQIDLSNAEGQGTYQMRATNGQTVAVPYGQVQKAAQGGYNFADDANRWRYAKDDAADPHRTTSFTPAANEQSPEGHRAAVYAREDATGPIGQVGIGVAKAAGTMLKPISDAASVVSGDDNDPNADQTDYTTARNGLQEVGKVGGTLAALVPAAAEAPVATAAALGTGTVSGLVGKVIGQHLGLNDKQTALLSDLFGIAGGIGGGAATARFVPGGASSASDLGDVVSDTLGKFRTAIPSDASPVDTAVSNAVGNAGIEAGSPASEPPSPEDLQPALHAGIRQVASDVAQDTGLGDIQPTTIRDTMGSVARGMYAASKDDYAALDQASGGRWQRYDDAIQNIDRKMSDLAGIDDDAYDNLQLRKNELETMQAQLLEDMKAEGKVDPEIADRAAAQYRRAMALQDVGNAIKASTKFDGQNEVIDPNGLANRLAKLNDVPITGGDSRLVQALDQDSADALLDHVNSAQIAARAVKNFVPSTPTGQVALDGLIRPNTMPSPSVINRSRVVTDWNGALRDFEKLGPDQQKQMFGGDVPKLRRYLQGQAQRQSALRFMQRVAPWAVGSSLGYEGYHVLHSILPGN